MKAGKIWGQTELIHANGVLEFHRIEYKKNQCHNHNLLFAYGKIIDREYMPNF